MSNSGRKLGIRAALYSAVFLGIAPVFGKQAILFGFSPLAVVTLRTVIASALLILLVLLFQRQYFYIYPVGLIGCFLAGFTNGLGSILYYTALTRLDTSIGHLLYSFYPLFVALWLLLDRQKINSLTLLRLAISVPGVYLLIANGSQSVDLIGAGLMLGSALLYALHLLINQRVLYEVPAPTVTLYTLLSMSITVVVAYLIFDRQAPNSSAPLWPIFGMALVTFLSRLSLFLGVKHLGGMQTSLLGLGELLVTVALAQIWLGDKLNTAQWMGAGLLVVSLLLVGFDKQKPEVRYTAGWLSWLNSPRIRPNELPWQ